MKKSAILFLFFAFISIDAQVRRNTANRTTRQKTNIATKIPVRSNPAFKPPIFFSRQDSASIGEMMLEPPTFGYGSSINVWLVRDESDKIREVAVTGHANSETCRRVTSQVLTMYINKTNFPEDLFVAGAAYMTDNGNISKRLELEEKAAVKEYVDKADLLDKLKFSELIRLRSPGEGTEEQTALGAIREQIKNLETKVEKLKTDPEVEKYINEIKSENALYNFTAEVSEFASTNGLVFVHELPLAPLRSARRRISEAALAGRASVVSFDDLLQSSELEEGVFFAPVLKISDGRPLELRIPKASLVSSTFEEARRNNRNEVEQAIIGNARYRLSVFNQQKKRNLETQKSCANLTPEQLKGVIILTQTVTAEGIIVQLDKPETITYEEYCKINIPINYNLINKWINNTKDLLKSVEEDAQRKDGSRLEDSNYSTLVDSMLRDWRLPVARSQAAFDTWRKTARGPVWSLLQSQLSRLGVKSDILSGEQLVFSVELDESKRNFVIKPYHIVDMARSVVVADPADGATRVINAWSLRTRTQRPDSTDNSQSPTVPELIGSIKKHLDAGDLSSARERLTMAFSENPSEAFRELEREWLNYFPNTRARLLQMQESVQPVVEAAEWKEAFENMSNDPDVQEEFRNHVATFDNFLESYPKAPVDLHMKFALELAGEVASVENYFNKRKQNALEPAKPEVTAWDVIEAFSQPSAATKVGVTNRTQVSGFEKYLRQKGYKGAELTKRLEILKNILDSRNILQTGENKFIDARSFISELIVADPAPMIQKAIQTIKERDLDYWLAASQLKDQPTERSREWQAAESALKREMSVLEEDALLLVRLEGGLKKSYLGSESANYLWSTASPNLNNLLGVIQSAVGDGRLGLSPYYLGVRDKVKFYSENRRKMDTLTRLQNAGLLQSGSESLLAVSRLQISKSSYAEPFRDAVPLRSRVWFESGEYDNALETLFPDRMPVALYHPNISWAVLTGDKAQRPLEVSARIEKGQIIFSAIFDDGKESDVLMINGLADYDAKSLAEQFNDIGEDTWSIYGKVSDQILSTPVKIRPAALNFRNLIFEKDSRLRIMKAMVYGRNAPAEDLLGSAEVKKSLTYSLIPQDQVKSDQKYIQIFPTLSEVKRIAAEKITSK